jgi:ABC-2 type transport system permease protein
MAVYKRTYTRYSGPLTNELALHDSAALRASIGRRIPLLYRRIHPGPGSPSHRIAVIYFRNHIDSLVGLGIDARALQILTIDGGFFIQLFAVETFISFFMAIALLGPGLIAPDLANNAMPLYLSRPFSRAEYVIGKLSVLLTVTSLITRVPGFAVRTSDGACRFIVVPGTNSVSWWGLSSGLSSGC